jgi:hypothetical protein
MGRGGMASCILNLGTRWRWVVSFTPWPLYAQGKNPRSPLIRRLGVLHCRSGRYGGERNLTPAGNWTTAVQPIARHRTDWANPIRPRYAYTHFKTFLKYNVRLYRVPVPPRLHAWASVSRDRCVYFAQGYNLTCTFAWEPLCMNVNALICHVAWYQCLLCTIRLQTKLPTPLRRW